MSKPGIKVFAPASVSNVAAGFDLLGFALEKPGDEIIVREGSQPGLVIGEIRGASGKLPYDLRQNTAGFAALKLLEHLGQTDRPIEMQIHKKMPIGSGIGSSAASAAGAVFAISEFLRAGLSKPELLPFALQGERANNPSLPADNVAASLLGGMILIRDSDSLDYKKLPLLRGLFAAVICPHVEVLTKMSRDILKKEVPFDDVVRQQGNLAGFVAAMYTSDFGLLARSLQDVLVEPQRAHLVPHFYAMKEKAMEAGAMGFSISGAGPAMFALCDNSLAAERVVEAANALYRENRLEISTYLSGINHEGARLY